jgi:hypothetical protein
LFFGKGVFRDRLAAAADEFSGEPNVAKIVDFIRNGKTRSLMMPRVGDVGSGAPLGEP